MISSNELAKIIRKIDNSFKKSGNYNQGQLKSILDINIFNDLFIVFNKYGFDNTDSSIDDEKFVIDIAKVIGTARGIHINWNKDAGRLLIRDLYHKIVFFPKNEHHVDYMYKKRDFIKLNGIGIDACDVKDVYCKNLKKITREIEIIREGKTIIGFYGQLHLSLELAQKNVKRLICKILGSYKKENIMVLSSGSGIGVGGLASSLARERGIDTIGIIPESMKNIINPGNFSYLISEGFDWGDQSYLFGIIPDIVIFSGGGFWSFLEYREAKSQKKPIFFYEFKGGHYCENFRGVSNRVCFSNSSIDNLIWKIKSNQLA